MQTAACALVAACLAQVAVADQFDTLNLVTGGSSKYDANLFRTPDSSGPPAGYSAKSDSIKTAYVGLRLDKPYALQRIQLNITRTNTRYDTFNYLNSEALEYRSAWLWALSPHLTGTISADRMQSQVDFADTVGTQRNIRTTTSRNFNLDAWVSGRWHLLAGASQAESKTEQTIVFQPSNRNYRMEAGLRYDAASGNAITFTRRAIFSDVINQSLDPVNLVDTNYRDDESELRASWKLTGKSTLDGSLIRRERSNDHFAQRDFSGIAHHLSYLWTPTGKLQFNLSTGREITAYTAFGNVLVTDSTYKLDQTQTFSAAWQVATKVAAKLNWSRTLSDYRGSVLANPGPDRHDDAHVASIGIDWSLLRSLSLGASLQRDRRSSNVPGFEFSDRTASLTASLTF